MQPGSVLLWNRSNINNPFDFYIIMGHYSGNDKRTPANDNKQTSAYVKTGIVMGSGMHMLDLSALNNLVETYTTGLGKIGVIQDYSIGISSLSSDGFCYNFGFFQRARTPNSAYHYWGGHLSATYLNIPYSSPLKLGIGPYISYQKHIINKPNTLNDTQFITRYNLPTTAVNPVFIVGLSGKAILDLSQIYISTEIGYGRDISNPRWLVNKTYSGNSGGLKGHQLFLNAGIGIYFSNSGKKTKP